MTLTTHECKSIHFFIHQHKLIKGLYQQIIASESRAPEMTSGIIQELLIELAFDRQISLNIFFPPIASILKTENDASVLDHCNQAIKRLNGLQSELPAHLGKESHASKLLALFQDSIELIETEDRELFPKLHPMEPALDEKLMNQILREKKTFFNRSENRDVRSRKAQNPSGGEQKRIALGF